MRNRTRSSAGWRAGLAGLAVIAVTTLGACAAPSGGSTPSDGSSSSQSATGQQDLTVLEDVTWRVTALTVDGVAAPVPETPAVTITFGGSPATLVARACNSLVGDLTGWPDTLALGNLAQTEMACEIDGLMATESALSTALPRVDQVEGDSSGVTLTGDGVELALAPTGDTDAADADADAGAGTLANPEVVAALEALAGREWALASGTVDGADVATPIEYPITLGVVVDDDGVAHLGGRVCNHWGMPLSGESAGEAGSNAMLCEGLMEAESAVMDAVTRLDEVTESGGVLTLRGDGVELVWDERAPLDLANLTDVTWSMQTVSTAGAAAVPAPDPTTWELRSDGTIRATSTCLVLTGEWTTSGSDVRVGTSQQDGTCTEAEMFAGGQALAALTEGFTASLADGVLTTTSMFGQVATHVPVP